MHIPDGLLDTKTWLTLNVLSAGFLGVSIKKVKDYLDERKVPLMGVVAAFIFAAQMLNFPIGGGTSGHFMGGVFAAILLGPFAGFIVMATVLIIQCFLFMDGGLLALGANIFNMGLIGSVLGYYIYSLIRGIIKNRKGIFIGTFIASWCSIVLAAGVCALELTVSGIVPAGIVIPAMVGVHALIGVGEGLITTAAVSFILTVRPDLLLPAEEEV